MLVGASELDIGLNRNGVVTLEQRVEELADRDRLFCGESLREVVSLEHPSHCVVRREFQQAGRAESVEPLRVPPDLEILIGQHERKLFEYVIRMRVDLVLGQHRPGIFRSDGSPIRAV